MKTFNIFLIFLLVFSFVSSSQAQPHQRKGMRGKAGPGKWAMMKGLHNTKWWKNPKLAKKVGITDEQKNKLKKLESESQKKIIKLGADMATVRIDLRDAMENPDLDEAKIKKLMEEIIKIQGEITRTTMNSILEGLKILTKEQRQKIIEMKNSGELNWDKKTQKKMKNKK